MRPKYTEKGGKLERYNDLYVIFVPKGTIITNYELDAK